MKTCSQQAMLDFQGSASNGPQSSSKNNAILILSNYTNVSVGRISVNHIHKSFDCMVVVLLPILLLRSAFSSRSSLVPAPSEKNWLFLVLFLPPNIHARRDVHKFFFYPTIAFSKRGKVPLPLNDFLPPFKNFRYSSI